MGRPSMRTATFEELNCICASSFGCQSTVKAGKWWIAALYFWCASSLTDCLYDGRRPANNQLYVIWLVNKRFAVSFVQQIRGTLEDLRCNESY